MASEPNRRHIENPPRKGDPSLRAAALMADIERGLVGFGSGLTWSFLTKATPCRHGRMVADHLLGDPGAEHSAANSR